MKKAGKQPKLGAVSQALLTEVVTCCGAVGSAEDDLLADDEGKCVSYLKATQKRDAAVAKLYDRLLKLEQQVRKWRPSARYVFLPRRIR